MPSKLFAPFALRDVTFRNRIFVSPMCQYSSKDGVPNDWHLVHLGSRAVGGAACVIQEATGVTPEGRITPFDAGLWNEAQMEAYRPIVQFLKNHGAVPAIQLAHAGRKASCDAPWNGGKAVDVSKGGWAPVAPSPVPFDVSSPVPQELSEAQIGEVVRAFVASARLALKAGYEVAEVHAAHGYLLHEFLSPLSNKRNDRYGGSLENRMRLTVEVANAVRQFWPQNLPVFVRISASDWVEGGWDIAQSVALCRKLKEVGIDLIDTSSAGLVPDAKVVVGSGYQTDFAAQIKRECTMPTGAVGMITSPQQAEHIIVTGQADCVLLAREMLRDPYWPLHAARALNFDMAWPDQYLRAKPQ